MGLFNEHPDWMTGKMASKPAKKRDMLFEWMLSRFHPTLTLDSIPDMARARLNKACKEIRQWPGFDDTDRNELNVRYGRMMGRTRWTTPIAFASHWDEFEDAAPGTRQPNMPSLAAGMASRHEQASVRRQMEDESAERNRAYQAVQLADANVVKALHAEWTADPDNAHYVQSAPLPTSKLCVRWIADRLEARNA